MKFDEDGNLLDTLDNRDNDDDQQDSDTNCNDNSHLINTSQ